jgi:signal transduction histidine kinase
MTPPCVLGKTRFTTALALALFVCACFAAAPARPIVFHEAQFVLSKANSLPGDTAPWSTVALPHQWRTTNPGVAGSGWYRIEFELDHVPQTPLGLEVDKFRSAWVDFYINGNLIGGSAHGPGASAGLGLNLPVYVAFSPALLHAGKNVLSAHMRTWTTPMNIQGLGRVRIGDADSIGSRARTVSDWGFYAESNFFAMAFTAGVVAFFLWLARRTDKVLFWYWVSCLSWVTAGALYHALRWVNAPFPLMVVLSVYRVYGLAVPAVILGMRIAGVRKVWPEVFLWAFLLVEGLFPVLMIAGVLPPALRVYAMPRVVAMDVINAVLLLIGAAIIAVETRRSARWTDIVSASALVLMAACMFYEAARIFGWIDIEAPVLRPYHVPALVFAMGVAIFERHVRAIWRMQRSNVELRRRVDEKAREIEAFHAEREERMRLQALVRERQRILADMHDGLGASLVGLLRYAQAGKLDSRALELRVKEALQELRIAIDALEPAEGDLASVLGKLRYRLEPLLESAGMRLVWEVDELPPVEALEPSAVFAIQRILLEAISNTIQHARAREIRFAAHAHGDASILITVEDDGSGFDARRAGTGLGLASMRRRADGLAASLDIAPRPGGGTVVRLSVPRRLGQHGPTAYPEAATASRA